MQKKLLVDMFAGNVPYGKNSKQRYNGELCKMISYVELIEPQYVGGMPTMIIDKHLRIHPDEVVRVLARGLEEDKTMQSFLRVYKRYRSAPHKNYIFGRPVISALTSIKNSLKTSYLPTAFNGFLDIPDLRDSDGDRIEGLFVHIYLTGHGDTFFECAYPLENGSIGHLTLTFPPEETDIATWCKQWPRYVVRVEGDNLVTRTDFKDDPTNLLELILNCIIYVTRSNEILVEQVNEFDGSKKAIERQEKIYSHVPFVRVGEGFEFVRVQHVDSTFVNPFYRMQPCGPSRANVKLTLVRGHERHYKR